MRQYFYFSNPHSLVTTSHLTSVTKTVENGNSHQYASLFAPTTYPYYDLNGSRDAVKEMIPCFIVKGNIDTHTHEI